MFVPTNRGETFLKHSYDLTGTDQELIVFLEGSFPRNMVEKKEKKNMDGD